MVATCKKANDPAQINTLQKRIHSYYNTIKGIVQMYTYTYFFTIHENIYHYACPYWHWHHQHNNMPSKFQLYFLEYYTALIKHQQHTSSSCHLLHNHLWIHSKRSSMDCPHITTLLYKSSFSVPVLPGWDPSIAI